MVTPPQKTAAAEIVAASPAIEKPKAMPPAGTANDAAIRTAPRAILTKPPLFPPDNSGTRWISVTSSGIGNTRLSTVSKPATRI